MIDKRNSAISYLKALKFMKNVDVREVDYITNMHKSVATPPVGTRLSCITHQRREQYTRTSPLTLTKTSIFDNITLVHFDQDICGTFPCFS